MKTQLAYRKSTKNTYVFDEVEAKPAVPSIIPTLYVRKDAFKNGCQLIIEVTIEVIE